MIYPHIQKMGILVADDEDNLRDIIVFNLEQQGYKVFPAKNGKEALDIFLNQKHNLHLALLDVSMPKINGFELCQKIKKIDEHFPVFFLTVRNESQDRVYGLKIGADDYLSKPFDLEELIIRINKILNRYIVTDKFYINQREIDFKTNTVKMPDGTIHHLSIKEASLLYYFIQNKNQPLSRQQILQAIWDDKAMEASYRTIDNFVLMYRKIFEDNLKDPQIFISIRGIGYLLKLEQ